MSTVQLIIICATVLLLAVIAAAARSTRQAAGQAPPRVGHRVTVHTKKPDDQTFYGVVTGDYTDRVVLEDASYVTPTGSTALPGRQDIATRDVAWIDVHAHVAPVPTFAPLPAAEPAA